MRRLLTALEDADRAGQALMALHESGHSHNLFPEPWPCLEHDLRGLLWALATGHSVLEASCTPCCHGNAAFAESAQRTIAARNRKGKSKAALTDHAPV